MKYLVVVEKSDTSWGAHVPNFPGCVAVGETRDEVVTLIRKAIAFHLEGMLENNEAIPAPSSEGEVVEIDAA